MADLVPVEWRPAVGWDCPECGLENIVRPSITEVAADEVVIRFPDGAGVCRGCETECELIPTPLWDKWFGDQFGWGLEGNGQPP